MAWITARHTPRWFSTKHYERYSAIYSARGFYFGQIDVETAYLYALVQELIYMRPPKGTNYGPNKICRLLKSLYGLKQAGRNWYLDLKDYLVELGFKPGEVDIGMYSAAVGTENEIWILVYVDDIIFASKNEQTKDILAGHLRKKYRITEPAQLTWALGMKISFAADGIILTQDLYMSKILERFGFTSAAKSATTPLAHGTTLTRADEEDAEARHLAQQFVGAILYAAVISRPDLSSTVRAMSHVMSKPPSNFEACKKHVLRYLSGTINRGIKYNTNSNVPLKLIGYCDASWGDNHENRRSTSGYIFFLNGGPISWASYLQTTVALSTVESEVMALTEAIKEAIYIRRLLESLGAAQEGPTIIYTDSTGAEALVDHPTSHRRTKHIEIRREFIKFHIGHETVKIERVSTKDQLADIMTKPLRQDIHNYLVQMILHGHDGDGIPVHLEKVDSDGDGIPDHHLEKVDSDGDGITDDSEDDDDDNDGISDSQTTTTTATASRPPREGQLNDDDGDGIPVHLEKVHSDGDGIPDHHLEKVDSDGDGITDDSEDEDDDNDGIPDSQTTTTTATASRPPREGGQRRRRHPR
ncbi:retrovirus-related Pol polyprotein [Pseudoscourfieldia marina]